MNDDMFFGADCVPDDFFNEEGKPRYIFKGAVPSGPKRKGMSQHALAWINNRTLLDMLFPKKKQRTVPGTKFEVPMEYPAHQGVPLCRSLFENIWANSGIQRALWMTSSSRFRKSNNLYVIGFLVYFCIKSGLAVKGRRTHVYVEITQNTKLKPAFRQIIKLKPQQFCLNDCVSKGRLAVIRQVHQFLEYYLPHPSVAETMPDSF